ncbi:MAG: hypothetical protein DRZ79_00420 [Candidatus Cloacimonadota bacterium]|nr:MAG: hypothetical protein DRZ79_00420 [Candidatus Cloacimonadota bacterium]
MKTYNAGAIASKTKKSHTVKDLNITSLIDILTLLLLFMLKNISMDASQKSAPEGMLLPTVVSADKLIESGQAVVVKIYPDRILYGTENTNVGSLQDFMTKRSTRKTLLRFLKLEAKEIATSGNKPCLLIQADKNLDCKYITEFIKFSAGAAFANIYFSAIHTDNKNEVLGL